MTAVRPHVVLEIKWRDPLVAFAPLAEQPMALAFISSGDQPSARWSILCVEPDEVFVDSGENALSVLPDLQNKYPNKNQQQEFPFTGGLAGLLSYELGAGLERSLRPQSNSWPDVAFGLYASCVLFDHWNKVARVLAPDMKMAKGLANRLGVESLQLSELPVLQNFQTHETDEEMAEQVERALKYIRAGDIFQANISRSFGAELVPSATPFFLFAQMLRLSAAPFCGYFKLDEHKIVLSNSPERFLRLDAQGHVQTHPIKGTRPRGKTKRLDTQLAKELQQSAKDRAENLMIVDLMRNDLSRVCQPGTVRVPQLFALQSFANVHHLVSTVCGQLRENAGPLELLAASFPPGSITGAPKIRAMQIISELENSPRGPYCGALGFMSNHGRMDFNVLIRTLRLQRKAGMNWSALFRAGGGIVADSNPMDEANEMNDKASIFRQLAGAA